MPSSILNQVETTPPGQVAVEQRRKRVCSLLDALWRPRGPYVETYDTMGLFERFQPVVSPAEVPKTPRHLNISTYGPLAPDPGLPHVL